MTYLDIVFRYGAAPGESELRAIDGMREVYGIRGVQFNEAERTVRVGYDASRLKADAVVGAWLMARAACGDDGGLSMPPAAGRDLAGRQEPLVQVRVDGKTVRGAKGADGSQVHLLAAQIGRRR